MVIVATGPFTPAPKPCQLLPSHLAIKFAEMPPADIKLPPTYMSVPETASVNTSEYMLLLKGLQLLPFHFAMWFKIMLLAFLK